MRPSCPPLPRGEPGAGLPRRSLPIAVPSYLHGRDIETPWELRIACSFVAGVLVHCAVSGLARTARSERWALRLTGSSLLFIVVIMLWAHWRSQQDAIAGNPIGMYHMTVVVIWPLVVAGLSMTDRGLSRLLSSDTMVYGGRISYCLYLVHWPVQNIGLALVTLRRVRRPRPLRRPFSPPR